MSNYMDTIVLKCKAQLCTKVARAMANKEPLCSIRSEWSYNEQKGRYLTEETFTTTLCHFSTGCRITIKPHGERKEQAKGYITLKQKNDINCRIQVSLPRLLSDTNSRCLSPEEAYNILNTLRSLLEEILIIDFEYVYLDRLDFAFQFECELSTILTSYRHAKTPLIHSDAKSFFSIEPHKKGSGLQWVGKNLSITFYDKAKEMMAKRRKRKDLPTGRILRMEVSFKNSEMIRRFFTRDLLKLYIIPPYFVLWRVVRTIIMSLTPDYRGSLDKYSEATLIALLEAQSFVLPNGSSVLEWRNKGRSTKRAREFTQKVQSYTPQANNVDLAKLLPVNVPPPNVDILSSGKMVYHIGYFPSFENPLTLRQIEVQSTRYTKTINAAS